MNILKKLTIKNLRLNRKRAIGTIIGIILSVALICAVSGMFVSFQASLVQNTINEYGYYHIALDGIDKSKYDSLKHNKDVRDIYKLYSLGYSLFPVTGDTEVGLLQVYSAEKSDLDELRFKLEEGHYPTNENEIILSKLVMVNSNYKVGDTIELSVGIRKTNDGYDLKDRNPFHRELEQIVNPQNKTYKVVGVVSRPNWSRNYYGITYGGESDRLKAYISIKNPRNYKNDIPEILNVKNMSKVYESEEQNGYYCTINNELLRWEVFKFSDSTMAMFFSLGTVVLTIIVVVSVFCIRNSFAISTLEKMKMYGMLSSVGATKKQIKKSVIYEGMVLGLIGIPIGVLSGIFADYVLIKVVNFILQGALFNYIDGLVFKVSFLAIVISILLGFVTIYLSSIFSAIKASKVSPIENLKNSNDIKITAKKLKTPKIVSSIFKTGGVLAYKNLKRSKKKYRTTVISLTVSIFAFISMSAFINEGMRETSHYYTDYDYNVAIYNVSSISNEIIDEIKATPYYKDMYFSYDSREYIRLTEKNRVNYYKDESYNPIEELGYIDLAVVALDDASFRTYVKKINASYEDMKNKGILCDEYTYYAGSGNEQKEKRVHRYSYEKGDVVSGVNSDTGKRIDIEIGKVSEVRPYGLEGTYYDGGYLVVNKEYNKNFNFYLYRILVNSDDTLKFTSSVEKISKEFSVSDFEETARQEKSLLLVVSIFLYGFITVITLIGVTNIFNTITSNMELRSKEFAMLKSVGMTKKEFNRMINLETILYSFKALLYGTVLGLIGAHFIHKSFSLRSSGGFYVPIVPIIISAVFVFIIVGIIMKYSLRKINKLNTIETIRNENV